MGFAKHILVAYDFSERARVALQNGVELAKRFGSKLTVLHVRDSSVPVADESGDRLETTEEVDETREARLSRVCADAIADLENTHTEVIESDDIAETLCEYAKDRGVDLIVAGNQGISGIVRVLMGSVAEEIVRHAPCAVLIVRVDEPS
jgi:nucleotide-binding universal stress UspA family protein